MCLASSPPEELKAKMLCVYADAGHLVLYSELPCSRALSYGSSEVTGGSQPSPLHTSQNHHAFLEQNPHGDYSSEVLLIFTTLVK